MQMFYHLFLTISLNSVHKYNTRLTSKDSYYISNVTTNYGKFNIRFIVVKIWNSIQENFKLEKRNQFKKLLKNLS